MNNQHTYMVKKLTVGHVYRDVLSGYLVLVRELHLQHAPAPVATGLMWNPLYGAHQPVTIYDHMLISATSMTALKPDTRTDHGYHGQ